LIVSCCINTYKRPDLLKNLLESIKNQKINDSINIEVIVVDNDPAVSGEPVIKSFSDSQQVKFKYFKQPEKNISLTRNKAVAESTGEWIAFIDDDGYADDNWISNYLNCLKTYPADGAFGQVIPYFEENVPQWIINGGFFDRLNQQTGEISKFTRTTNCLIRAEQLRSLHVPFNPKFGLTGGEDVDLFSRLKAKGARFIYCKEAIVYDFVPRDRATLKWLSKRTFRTGLTFTEGIIYRSGNRFLRRCYELIKGIVYLILSGFLTIFYLPWKIKRIYWYLKIISNFGHIAAVFNLSFEEYK